MSRPYFFFFLADSGSHWPLLILFLPARSRFFNPFMPPALAMRSCFLLTHLLNGGIDCNRCVISLLAAASQVSGARPKVPARVVLLDPVGHSPAADYHAANYRHIFWICREDSWPGMGHSFSLYSPVSAPLAFWKGARPPMMPPGGVCPIEPNGASALPSSGA